MTNRNNIILNTGVSYVSLVLKMIIGLFSVRLILRALGEVDYGVYIIVGGIVAMLDILNSNMTNTSMRYLAYSLGNKNKDDILVTFNTTVFIHYIIGLITIVILEVGGIFMFEYIVNIPAERMHDARIIYQFMIATTFINIISVPYDAVTNAHEHIWILSVFDILNSCLVLLLSLYLLVFDGNRLLLYGFSLLLIQLLMRFFKVLYAKRKFGECRKIKREYIERERIKGIISFTGWNLFGSLSALGMKQFRSFMLNFFFGVRVNAAEGVTHQVANPLNMIVSSMTRAINPQIMKSEGGENRERMKYIVAIGSKYSTFLFAVFGIPVLIEIPFLLDIWLDKVPEFAVAFCQLSIISMLLEKFTFQIVHAISAVGNIRNFQIAGAFSSFVYLPLAWLAFKYGYSPVSIYVLSLLSTVLMALVRLHYGRTVAGINPLNFIKKSVLPVLWPLLISSILAIILYVFIHNEWINLLAVFFAFVLTFTSLFWFIGMEKAEQNKWRDIIQKFLKKLRCSKKI